MTDTKTTPAPAAENATRRQLRLAAERVRAWPESTRAAHAMQSAVEHWAQLRAADARSARRFEGL